MGRRIKTGKDFNSMNTKTDKSNCCNSETETETGKGTGIYSATTGFLICKKCGKYCAYKWVNFTKDTMAESNGKGTDI